MVEIAVGITKLKDGRENTVSENGIGYPECKYYEPASFVDGMCQHPKNKDKYCSLSNKPKDMCFHSCPFDIHKELYG